MQPRQNLEEEEEDNSTVPTKRKYVTVLHARKARLDPNKMLWIAVLQDWANKVRDKKGRFDVAEVLWAMNESTQVGSFPWICTILGYKAATARKNLIERGLLPETISHEGHNGKGKQQRSYSGISAL